MKEMSKARTVLFCIALFLSTFTIVWQMYEVVIVNDLYVAFPDEAAIVTGLLSWPVLVTAIASMIAGPMLSKISTKTELIIAGILMLAGIVPAYVSNIYVLLVCSILMGFAAGISNTAGMTIIGEVFLDEKMRNNVIGWYSASMTIISSIVTLLGGVLAVNGWQVGFNIYWYVVPMLILCIIFLPNVKPEDRVAEGEPAPETSSETSADAQPQEKKGFGKRFWMFFIPVMIFCIAYQPIQTYLSVYVSENGLGGTDFSGLAVTMTTVGSLIVSLVFGVLFSKLKRGLNVLCYILPIFVYLLMYLFPSVPSAIIGSLVYGACYGGIFSFIYAYPSYVVPAEKMGTAMGLMTMDYSFGVFLGVYVASWLMNALGGTITAVFPVAIAMLLVALCFEIPGYLRDRKEHLFDEPQQED